MHSIIDIPLGYVLASLLLFAIPLFIFRRFGIPLAQPLMVAVVRMVAQLAFIALYLEYIFSLNSFYVNAIWIFFMLVISAFTATQRSGLSYRIFVLPIFIAAAISLCIIDSFIFGIVLPAQATWDPQYMIPISGMIVGNAMNHNIVGLTHYFESLAKRPALYQFILTNTGDFNAAVRPYIKNAVQMALNPLIANMAVIGLISLPGMMTGQILGGSPPAIAIKYQVLIMAAIFTGCSLTLLLSMVITRKWTFDTYRCIKPGLLVREPKHKKHGHHGK